MHERHEQAVDEQIDPYEAAMETIAAQLSNHELLDYALGEGPLTLKDLSDDALERVTMAGIVYEWPTADDAVIKPTRKYTDETFLQNLFEKPSFTPGVMPYLSEAELNEQTERNEYALNNFILYLRASPADASDMASNMANVYGESPVVHRADALAPELFDALRVIMNGFKLSEQKYARTFLEMPMNADVVTALHMSYQIMGRLLKVSDESTGVRDAHETLTA